MDDSRFDALLCTLITARSRRRALEGLAVGLLGPFGSWTDEAGAKKKHHKQKKPCPPCKRRKKGKCKITLPDGTPCSGGTCQGGSCVPTPPTCTPDCTNRVCGDDGCGGSCGACRVFVTSTTHTGNLGGLSGADVICQHLATTAGLPGTYKAWLSDSTGSPSTRFVHNPGPYVLVDGLTQVANDWADLTTCNSFGLTDDCLDHVIDRTETGAAPLGLSWVWTSTNFDGTAAASPTYHCENWSNGTDEQRGWAGDATFSDADWTNDGHSPCSEMYHLYCFQQR